MSTTQSDPSKLLEAAIGYCWQSGMTGSDILDFTDEIVSEITAGGRREPHRLAESRMDVIRIAASLSERIDGKGKR